MEKSNALAQIRSFSRSRGLPIIPVNAKDVSIINEPSVFYNTILQSVRKAKNRLALSALYLGAGPKERSIVQAIYDNSRLNPKLNVNIVLDANRATRQDDKKNSSITILKKILELDNVKLSLVDSRRNKTFMDVFMKGFQKLNEISSTYHSKILLFDKDVIMTGANLSSIYFENRQDRYMVIKNSEPLSHYLYQLLELVGHNSNLMEKIDILNEAATESSSQLEDTSTDSWIIPIIQHGPSGINSSDEFLTFLGSILPKSAEVHLSSGYFNPSTAISSLRLTSVLAPSEKANGFYGGSGLLKYIPRLYSALHKQFLEVNQRCKFYLYDRSGWSFHAKGIWVDGLDDLYVHHFGSSNYNCRSSERDFEAQLILLTKNKKLIKKLQQERSRLWNESSLVEPGIIQSTNVIYSTFAHLFRRFL